MQPKIKGVCLGIDPGEKSGYAISVCGEIVAAYEISRAIDRKVAVECSENICIAEDLPLIVVIEKWGYFGGGRTCMGLGIQKGKWLEALELGGIKHSHINYVRTQDFRFKMLGLGPRTPREIAKKVAMKYAATQTELTLTDNVAEAICLAQYPFRTLEGSKMWPKIKGAQKRNLAA